MKVPTKRDLRAELERSEKLVTALAHQNDVLRGLVKVLSRECKRLMAELQQERVSQKKPTALRVASAPLA